MPTKMYVVIEYTDPYYNKLTMRKLTKHKHERLCVECVNDSSPKDKLIIKK